MDPKQGEKKTRNFAANAHIHQAGFVKGGAMTKLTPAGEEKKRWDYALCQRQWFKLPLEGEQPTWTEDYAAIHSIEPDLDEPKRFRVWLYKRKKDGGAAPALCSRYLACENEGERDDWVLTFRTLLMNFWHERLEATIIPAPEVYQFHTFVQVGAGTDVPHLLALSTTTLRIATALPGQPAQSTLTAPISGVAGLEKNPADPKKLAIVLADGQTAEITLKDAIEALVVIAEIKRLQSMAK